MKKRTLALIASAIFTISLISGCGDTTQIQPTISEETPTMPTIDPLPPEGTETYNDTNTDIDPGDSSLVGLITNMMILRITLG